MDTLKREEKDGGNIVTVGVGIIEINEKLSMEQIIKKVDEVLYCSKENGRGSDHVLQIGVSISHKHHSCLGLHYLILGVVIPLLTAVGCI